ncbi:MAG: DUF2271 domain-containing protein [Pseudomonadota bacterium]|nr:DUF2271 domain-containing protein [Pseudomonadota bacterium]
MKLVAKLASATLLIGSSAGAFAAELNLKLQLPRLDVAEYHRPYIAVWVENQDQSAAAQLAVWYQTDRKKEDGTQWLKDLRQWWRRGGRELQMPVDGVTGATRPAGEHVLSFKSTDAQLAQLAPGKYNVVVEATREVGGRELLRLPFEWPGTQKQQATAQGKSELGAVTLNITP